MKLEEVRCRGGGLQNQDKSTIQTRGHSSSRCRVTSIGEISISGKKTRRGSHIIANEYHVPGDVSYILGQDQNVGRSSLAQNCSRVNDSDQ